MKQGVARTFCFAVLHSALTAALFILAGPCTHLPSRCKVSYLILVRYTSMCSYSHLASICACSPTSHPWLSSTEESSATSSSYTSISTSSTSMSGFSRSGMSNNLDSSLEISPRFWHSFSHLQNMLRTLGFLPTQPHVPVLQPVLHLQVVINFLKSLFLSSTSSSLSSSESPSFL